MKFSKTKMAAAGIGAVALMALAATPASAAQLGGLTAAGKLSTLIESPVEQVQRRRGRRGGSGAGAAAVGVGIGLGVIGGIIATEAARNSARAEEAAVRDCMRRFRSYDPETRTYIGRDGYEYPCP